MSIEKVMDFLFQSSFELTGYITFLCGEDKYVYTAVSKLFRAYGLYNLSPEVFTG